MSSQFYHSSGKFGPLSFVFLIGCLILAFFLAFPYVFLVYWNPFVYLSLLINMGYGIIISAGLYFALRKGRVRNNTIVYLFATILSLVAIYGVWVWYVYIRTKYQLFTLSLRDMAIVAAIVAEKGPWKVSGRLITGWQVYVAWFVEAGLIALVTYLSAGVFRKDSVYCEQCGRWAEKLSVKSLDFPRGSNVTKEKVVGLNGEPLLALEKTALPPAKSVELELFHCPKPEHQLYYASVHSKVAGSAFTVIQLKISEALFGKLKAKNTPT